jgi:mycothiol system anti-sigma-R factor
MASADGEQPTEHGHCDDVLESMYLYLDKEQLSAEQRAEVRSHLDECIPCIESFEFEMELKQIIKTKCRDEVPAHVYEKIRAQLSVEVDATSQIPPDA